MCIRDRLYAPDGRSIISGTNGILTIWDLTTGSVERTIVGNRYLSVFRLEQKIKGIWKNGRITGNDRDYFEIPYKDFSAHTIPWFPQNYEAYIKTLFSPDGKFALRGYFVLYDNAAESPVGFQQHGKSFLMNILKQNRGRVWFWYPGFGWRGTYNLHTRSRSTGPWRVLRSPDGEVFITWYIRANGFDLRKEHTKL